MTSDRAGQLEQIAEEIEGLEESPLYRHRKANGYLPVTGGGRADAEIMFVGEAPGKQEAKTGRPFVGRAGRLLDELLESVGLNRGEVYITNVVKDRPPGNRNPRADEIEVYGPFLLREIEIVEPDAIVTLGRFATRFVLGQFGLAERGQTIGNLHGEVLTAEACYGEVHVVPLYHPAAVFYNRDLQQTLEDDFQKLKQFV